VTEVVSETLTEAVIATAVSETSAQAVTAEYPVFTPEPAPLPTENYTKNSYKAINYSEMKGVWISYIEVSVLLRGKSESEFRQAAVQIYENCLSLGINTVYVHARAFGDSFYYSELFPFTKHISGAVGVKTDYDPYLTLIDEAHKRGISFHAWINPLRLCGSGDLNAVSSDYQIKKWYNSSTFNGSYLVQVDGTWYLNPAYDQTVKLVSDGVREIVSRYNVDGIHIDDYFYPTTDESFDSIAYAASNAPSLSAFRTENCNKLVREIYRAAHECSDTVVFGISPQGSNSNNLDLLYADVRAWCKGGYVDYFVPQIYYGFQNSTLPFKECADEWDDIVNGTQTQLCIGLAVYKIGAEDQWADEGRYEWLNSDTMLRRQIEYAQSCKNYGGVALYCYNYLFTEGFLTLQSKKKLTILKVCW
ncbi:MAG: family 10 glycosylhydrolase, partial [Ruminiclostridium sp.]|nr:family 10 glycosylhydrolase [Ruminiclostridium sp.]